MTKLVDAVVAEYKNNPPAVVIFDPLVSFGASEQAVNDNEQALITAARRIRKGLDCCVRYVHHTGQGNAREKSLDQYSGRGGTALADGTRMTTVMQVWRPGDKFATAPEGLTVGPNTSITVLARPKLSYAPPNLPLIWIQRNGFRFEHVVQPTPTPEQGAQTRRQKVLDYLRDKLEEGVRLSKGKLEDRYEEVGVSRDKLRAAVDDLLAGGQVRWEDLPQGERQGGFKQYLHPTHDLADSLRGVDADDEDAA